jgi:general secretion pathway protein K
MRRLSAPREDQRGFALVMVIWGLALLSLMAAAFMTEARTELRRAANLRERAQAEALAEAGIHLAIARLVSEHGSTYPLRWTEKIGDHSVTIEIADERGRIDVNNAEPELLSGLLRSQGVPETAASALTDAILDFTDPDHDARLNGAEDSSYPAGSGGAKDARLETADEFLQVKGMTPTLYAKLAPLITVHSGLPTISPIVAEAEAFAAVPNIDRSELERFLALRAKLAPALQAPAEPGKPGAAERERRRGKAFAEIQAAIPRRNLVDRFFMNEAEQPEPRFRILAEAKGEGGARFRREAVVRMDEESAQPFRILEWRRPLD